MGKIVQKYSCVCAVLFSGLWSGLAFSTSPTPALVDMVHRGYTELYTTSRELEDTIKSVCHRGGLFSNVQYAYKDFITAWSAVRWVNSDIMVKENRKSRIDYTTRKRDYVWSNVDKVLNAQDSSFIAKSKTGDVDIQWQGLPLIEILMYKKSIQRDGYACQLAQAAASNITLITQAMGIEWRGVYNAQAYDTVAIREELTKDVGDFIQEFTARIRLENKPARTLAHMDSNSGLFILKVYACLLYTSPSPRDS